MITFCLLNARQKSSQRTIVAAVAATHHPTSRCQRQRGWMLPTAPAPFSTSLASSTLTSTRNLPFTVLDDRNPHRRRQFSSLFARCRQVLFRGGSEKEEVTAAAAAAEEDHDSPNVFGEHAVVTNLAAQHDETRWKYKPRRHGHSRNNNINNSTDSPQPPPPLSIHSIQGYREYMEDEFCTTEDMLAIFDGHGGSKVSRYLRTNLGPELIKQQQQQADDCATILRRALHAVNNVVHGIRHWSFQGSTVVALWRPVPETCYVANIGDSRAVLGHKHAGAVPLTRDHKPSDPAEQERIESVGGSVSVHWGVSRVNGQLALSRAIGDRAEFPAVSGEPEITVLTVDEDCEFVLLATDGVWDVFSNEDVVDLVRQGVNDNADDIAGMIVHEALRRGSYDNITVLIMFL